MRKAFGLLTAIMFIVLVATIGALALSFSTQTNRQTSDAYLKAQAELLSYSATEYALLALSGHKISSNCIEKISANYNDFKIYVTFKYIGNNLPAACPKLTGADAIATPYSNVTVLMDTIIEFNATIGNEPIRIHRRTLQKP